MVYMFKKAIHLQVIYTYVKEEINRVLQFSCSLHSINSFFLIFFLKKIASCFTSELIEKIPEISAAGTKLDKEKLAQAVKVAKL